MRIFKSEGIEVMALQGLDLEVQRGEFLDALGDGFSVERPVADGVDRLVEVGLGHRGTAELVGELGLGFDPVEDGLGVADARITVLIGAGSVVTKDIPSDSMAVGNPCRVMKKLNE